MVQIVTIAWMLTRMVTYRFLAILSGIVIFVTTLDVTVNVDDILRVNDGQWWGIPYYALLLLPSTASTFLPIAVLLALLLTLMELSYRSEMTAIWATGISPVGLIAMLVPVGLLLGSINFGINDMAVPKTVPTLYKWGIGDYRNKQLNISDKDPIWMRAGNDILRAVNYNPQATVLHDVIIFRRNAAGQLTEQDFAESARQVGGRWVLHNVVVYYQENLPPNRIDTLIYSGNLKPAATGARSGDPREMTINDLSYFIDNSGFGIRPAHVYETWWHKRMAMFFSACLMVAICVPLAARFRRGGGIGILFFFGVALGFVFFIIDGISLTMGELGLLPPWMAGWLPLMIYSGIAATMVLKVESLA